MAVLAERYKGQLVEIIHKYVPHATIYLFGSRATGKARSGSDIDLALDAGAVISRSKIIAILLAIDETIIPVTVDVIDMCVVSEDMKQAILREGIRWTD